MDTSDNSNRRSNRLAVAITALICLGVGAIAGAWFIQRGSRIALQMPAPIPASVAPTSGSPPTTNDAFVVSIPSDAIERMGLSSAEVTVETSRSEIRVPGTVEADGYREVPVTPVAGGIVREVTAELGQEVKRGDKMARIFSQELADAQANLIAMQTDLEVTHKKLTRTQELVTLGAASRQELEEVEGEHQVHMAHIEQARQKLILLGMNPAQVDQVRTGNQVSSEITVPSPMDGVVLARSVNLGQVVGMGQELFKVTDLSSVWIEANLLEDDFVAVQKGSQAVITMPAYAGRIYRGTVDYIDPRVDPQTRTAKVRVIVANRDGALRLGMYADVLFTSAQGRRMTIVPTLAVQQIGERSVVYVPVSGQENRFEQRPVTVGEETSHGRQVLTGLREGERVVTRGSFLLRAEALRQHPE